MRRFQRFSVNIHLLHEHAYSLMQFVRKTERKPHQPFDREALERLGLYDTAEGFLIAALLRCIGFNETHWGPLDLRSNTERFLNPIIALDFRLPRAATELMERIGRRAEGKPYKPFSYDEKYLFDGLRRRGLWNANNLTSNGLHGDLTTEGWLVLALIRCCQ